MEMFLKGLVRKLADTEGKRIEHKKGKRREGKEKEVGYLENESEVEKKVESKT